MAYDKIKLRLKELGKEQGDMATALGFSDTTISDWLNDERISYRIREYELVMQLAEYLEWNLLELLDALHYPVHLSYSEDTETLAQELEGLPEASRKAAIEAARAIVYVLKERSVSDD